MAVTTKRARKGGNEAEGRHVRKAKPSGSAADRHPAGLCQLLDPISRADLTHVWKSSSCSHPCGPAILGQPGCHTDLLTVEGLLTNPRASLKLGHYPRARRVDLRGPSRIMCRIVCKERC